MGGTKGGGCKDRRAQGRGRCSGRAGELGRACSADSGHRRRWTSGCMHLQPLVSSCREEAPVLAIFCLLDQRVFFLTTTCSNPTAAARHCTKFIGSIQQASYAPEDDSAAKFKAAGSDHQDNLTRRWQQQLVQK